MDLLAILFFLAAGFLAGLVALLYGTGIAVILAPLALIVLRASGVSSLVATHLAFGSTLAAIAVAVMANVVRMFRSEELDRTAVNPGGIGALLGGIGGAMFAASLHAPALQRAAGVVLAIAALRLYSSSTKKKEQPSKHPFIGMFGVGIASGGASGLTGGGGDTVGSALLSSGYNFTRRKAATTALAMNLAALFAGAVVYVLTGSGNPLLPPGNFGFINPYAAASLALGLLAAGVVSPSVTPKVNPERSAHILGVILLVGAIRLLFFS
jgi:uncharacterized protein